jgi:hypothetical protein
MDVRKLSIHPNRRAGLTPVAATIAGPDDAVFIDYQFSESRKIFNQRYFSCPAFVGHN